MDEEEIPDFKTETLIALVETRPSLYDQSHSDTSVNWRLWREIVCELVPTFEQLPPAAQI